MKRLVCITMLNLFTWQMFPQINYETKAEKMERMEWWIQARFGMFIHWGLYSLPARHEWVMSNEEMPKKASI